MRALPAALASLLLVLVLAGCAESDSGATTASSPGQMGTTTGTGTGAAGATEVVLVSNAFVPNRLNLTVGASAQFLNQAADDHTVTVHWVGEPPTTLRKDEVLSAGESTSFTFADAGTYHVWCRFHGTMTGGMAMVVTVA